MKLFNKLYLIIFVALAFACDPYEETFQEMEESKPGPIANIEITLNDDDYAMLEGVEGAESAVQYGNFDNEEDVREFIPIILSQKFPLFDNKSLVNVNYDYYRGFSSEVRPFSNADEFSFGADEYAIIGENAATLQFVNSKSDVFNVLLESNPDAEEGDVLIVSYDYADLDYEGIDAAVLYSENFEELTDLSSFDTYSLVGDDQTWELDGSTANMSGYAGSNTPNEDWMVIPELDLTDASSAVALRIAQGVNFKFGAEYGEDIAIRIATDYDGSNVETANWENLDVQNWPAGNNWDLVDSEASLADYAGQTVSLGFFYRSTNDFAPNWDIDVISIEDGASIETETIESFYQFEDGSWTIPQNAYYLTADDYDAMGAPGQYDNFSGDVPPADYLPKLLNQKYPYAIEEEQKIIVYKYYSGEVQIRGDLYTFTSGNWEVYGSAIVEQLQFAKEEGVWVPDNTIAYTLTGDDYQQIGDIAIENGDVARGENLQQYGNFYQNFPGGDTHWSDEQLVAIFDQFLKIKYPDLGPGQKFTITYLAYTGSAVELQMNLIQNEEGNYVINE